MPGTLSTSCANRGSIVAAININDIMSLAFWWGG
jgi:hypothetical protein